MKVACNYSTCLGAESMLSALMVFPFALAVSTRISGAKTVVEKQSASAAIVC